MGGPAGYLSLREQYTFSMNLDKSKFITKSFSLPARKQRSLLARGHTRKLPHEVAYFYVWSRQESNLHRNFRKVASYPLNDGTNTYDLNLHHKKYYRK